MSLPRTFSVADARRNFAEVLSLVEQGVPVVIQRREKRFKIEIEPLARPKKPRAPRIEVLDPELEAGTWTWSWRAGELTLAHPRPKKGAR